MASWTERKQELEDLAHKFEPSVKLRTKDNFVNRVISWILHILSFGKMNHDTYMNIYATTLGNYMFYPASWSYGSVAEVLPHEARHVTQFRRFGFGLHALLGIPIAALVYLCFPLPAWFAWGRFWMELDADTVAWKYQYPNGTDTRLKWHAEQRVKAISGPGYLWAVSYSYARKRYDKLLADLDK